MGRILREYFLPPVIPVSGKKGEIPLDKRIVEAILLSYFHGKARKSVLRRRRLEKIVRIIIIYYPVDLICSNNKCIVTDPVRGVIVEDRQVLAALASLLEYSMEKPFIDEHILIEEFDIIELNVEGINEKYRIPRPRFGQARYYIPFIAVLYRGKNAYRVSIEPPLRYDNTKKIGQKGCITRFEELTVFIERLGIEREELIDRILLHNWIYSDEVSKNNCRTIFMDLVKRNLISKRLVEEIEKTYLQ